MTVPFPVVVLALVAAIGMAAFVAWAVYQLLPEKVFLRNHTMVKKYGGKIEQMPIADIGEIKYHYQAVVGFVAVWEFIDKNARSLSVDGNAKGVDEVLTSLEKSLVGFSLADLKRKFDEGDVEDAIDVWKAA